jgi:hypothetical protein
VPAAVFICEVCHELFPSDAAVRQHLPTCVASAQQLLECPDPLAQSTPPAQECQYCGLLVINITDHLTSHFTAETGFIQCLYAGCRNISFTSTELKDHLKLSHRVKDYCLVCGRFFSNLPALYNHRRLHSELLQFTCDLPGCGYIGNEASDQQLHKNLAHLTAAYRCNYCSRNFMNLKSRSLHINNHKTGKTGVFKCTYLKCATMTFTAIADLTNHVQNEHTLKKNLQFCE